MGYIYGSLVKSDHGLARRLLGRSSHEIRINWASLLDLRSRDFPPLKFNIYTCSQNMCGISVRISLRPSDGSDAPKKPDVESIKGQLDRSLDLIAHRGPDSKGIWVSDDGSVGEIFFFFVSFRK